MRQKCPMWISERPWHLVLWKECRGIGWPLWEMCALPFCFPFSLSAINIFLQSKKWYFMLTFNLDFSTSYKMARLCAWSTWENRNALSWKIRNLENHRGIILRSVEAIAFCRSCHSVGRMDLEVLVNRHLRVRCMTVFVIRTVMSYSCSPMYCKYLFSSQWTLWNSDMF